MVDNKKQRKSTRNFNMEKHVERHFDIEKEEAPVVAEVSGGKSADAKPRVTAGGDNSNGSKNKMLALVAIVVLAIVAFVAYRSCGSNENTVEEPTNTVVSDSTEKEKTDTTSTVETTNSESGQPQSTVSEGSSETEAKPEPNSVSNEPISTNSSTENTVEEKAKQVWEGLYGNGAERKSKLGSDYKAVQKRVNEMYRNGYRH